MALHPPAKAALNAVDVRLGGFSVEPEMCSSLSKLKSWFIPVAVQLAVPVPLHPAP
jgi:hypothetical protein